MSATYLLSIGLLGLLALYGYGSGREMPYERVLYGAVFCLITAIAFFSNGVKFTNRTSRYAYLWIAIAGMWLFVSAFQDDYHPTWILGDMAGIVLPASLLLCSSTSRELFGLSGIRYFVMFHAVGALLAPLVFHYSQLGDRYETPHFFLFVVLWVLFARAQTTAGMLASLSAIGLYGIIAFFSTQRTNVVLILPIGVAVLLLRGCRVAHLAFLGCVLLLAGIIGGLMPTENVTTLIQSSRFTKLTSGIDDSTLNRWYEVLDVFEHISDSWRPMQYGIGEGHGASFHTIQARTREENYSASGTLHNIHVGPVLILFRYGIVGSLLLVAQIAHVISTTLLARGQEQSHLRWDAHTLFAVAFTVSIIYGCMYPVLPSPTFSYIWAGVMYYSLNPVEHPVAQSEGEL
jgi:hypothetical protein